MSLLHPSETGVTGQQAVSNTQREFKTLMQKIASALRNAGACVPGAAPTNPPGYPAPEPALATITENTAMNIDVKRYSKFIPNPNEWERRVGSGRELHYGDTFCFKGRGTVKLKWYDGSIVSLSDAHALGERGKYAHCFEITLKRPEDMTSPGVIRDGATYVWKVATDALPALTRVVIDTVKDTVNPPPEVGDHTVVLAVKGTTFVIGQGASPGASLVCAEEHTVHVTPLNSALAPFDLTEGNQVQVTANAVGAITPGCTLPTNTAIPQPNTNATRMTLQAAQRSVFAGDSVLAPVWLIKANNLANLNFEIEYDPTVIQLAGDATKGNLLDNALFSANGKQSGKVLIGLAQTTALQGTGTVLNLPFRVVGKPGDVSPLTLSVTTINDPGGGKLEIDRIAGEIVVVNDDGTFPQGPGGGGSGTGGGISQGDCDGSGVLNELDALCALEMSTGIRTVRLVVDMDSSGDVTSRDAVIILQRAVGK